METPFRKVRAAVAGDAAAYAFGGGAADGGQRLVAGGGVCTVRLWRSVPLGERRAVADAAVSTALEVVFAGGVEGNLPVPGSLLVRRGGGLRWRVQAVHDGSAAL